MDRGIQPFEQMHDMERGNHKRQGLTYAGNHEGFFLAKCHLETIKNSPVLPAQTSFQFIIKCLPRSLSPSNLSSAFPTCSGPSASFCMGPFLPLVLASSLSPLKKIPCQATWHQFCSSQWLDWLPEALQKEIRAAVCLTSPLLCAGCNEAWKKLRHKGARGMVLLGRRRAASWSTVTSL